MDAIYAITTIYQCGYFIKIRLIRYPTLFLKEVAIGALSKGYPDIDDRPECPVVRPPRARCRGCQFEFAK